MAVTDTDTANAERVSHRRWLFMRTAVFVGLCGLVVAGLILFYQIKFTHYFNYRLTVVVDDNGRPVSGSSVIAVTSRLDLVPGRPPKYTRSITGEAPFVDLGKDRVLFALLERIDNTDAAYFPDEVFFPTRISESREEAERRLAYLRTLSKEKATRTMDNAHLPRFVAFHNLLDPRSVFEVKPGRLDDVERKKPFLGRQ